MIGLTMVRSRAHMQLVLTMWNGVVVIGDNDYKLRSVGYQGQLSKKVIQI